MTNLFKKHPVSAIVTKSKSDSKRLFLCTVPPEQLHFDTNCSVIGKALRYAETNQSLLPLTIYALRWHIETAYYEQKKFWPFGNYMLLSRDGIKCLLNLLTLVYFMMSLLLFPFCQISALSKIASFSATGYIRIYFLMLLYGSSSISKILFYIILLLFLVLSQLNFWESGVS